MSATRSLEKWSPVTTIFEHEHVNNSAERKLTLAGSGSANNMPWTEMGFTGLRAASAGKQSQPQMTRTPRSISRRTW
jgi:hypothetical protein